MKKFSMLNKYLIDNEYRIIIYSDRIDIVNYDSIGDFSSNKIIINSKNGVTTINGENLVISKMKDNELIIVGKFTSICV